MNRFVQLFENRFAIMRKKEWNKIYVGIDIHETMLLPTWSREKSTVFYQDALDTLRLMSNNKNICLILWSCSIAEDLKEYHDFFKSHNIHFDYINSNPECKSTDYADFETKLYFDVGIDDKFAFLPEEDWPALKEYFTELNNI